MSTREEQLRACGLDAVALARRWAAELARGAPAPGALR